MPAVKQIANVAALPGIVGSSIALPDVHSGYGFAIGKKNISFRVLFPHNKMVLAGDQPPGNVAAFDMDDPEAIVSPGGVGFDINCGVRLLRTNLTEKDINPVIGLLEHPCYS